MSTLHTKYKSLFEHTGRYSIITGGRNSGKSYAVTDMILKLTFEKGHKILYTRLTMESAYESIIAGVKTQIDELKLSRFFTITRTTITNKLTKSSIVFKGLRASTGDSTSRLKSLTGFTTLVIEEADEFKSEDEFDKINYSIRTIRKQLRIILILNPSSKSHWIYQRFFLDKSTTPGFNGVKDDICYVHTNYKDCYKWVPNDIRKEIADLKERRYERYRHIFLGDWLDKSEGVIFSDWLKGKYPTDIESQFGGDYGFKTDPSTLIEVAIDREAKKIYLRERLFKRGLTTSALAKIYLEATNGRLVVADSAEPRLIDEIKSFGVKIIPAKKGAGSVLAGITLMQDFTLVVDEDSTNLITELENYEWSKKREAPVDAFNHCFTGDTMITTINGQVPIKDIKPNDLVLTTKGYKPVLKRWDNGKKQVKKYWMKGDTFNVYISSTPEHKIYTTNGWKMISELQSGMKIYLHNSSVTSIVELKTIEEVDCYEQQVYDLFVDEQHEYFANNILVHNCIDAARYIITEMLRNKHTGIYHFY